MYMSHEKAIKPNTQCDLNDGYHPICITLMLHLEAFHICKNLGECISGS